MYLLKVLTGHSPLAFMGWAYFFLRDSHCDFGFSTYGKRKVSPAAKQGDGMDLKAVVDVAHSLP
jgi:hypothetical protein